MKTLSVPTFEAAESFFESTKGCPVRYMEHLGAGWWEVTWSDEPGQEEVEQ
jgi:hypothetical protein